MLAAAVAAVAAVSAVAAANAATEPCFECKLSHGYINTLLLLL